MEPVTLRTDRLELSIPRGADADAIFVACQDDGIQRFTTVPNPYTRRDAAGFPVKAAAGWAEVSETTWALRRDGVLAGMIGLHGLGRGAGEIGYWLAPGSRGEGLMTEAAAAVVDWGFEGPLGLARIEWRAVVGNTASARVAASLGFRYGGGLRRALVNGSGVRSDAWIADLLPGDPREPVTWPVL
ncbi:GNAT family N-acetyltransferase [Microbacterium sp. SORGH_AS_0888]|uniref:GNAT family N-acetyltransferase n=1 Tax=Microbacterium sp. SORGH_AS_0888 TaxID=3041791 RepID=UPI0027867ACD|nr:GNAT family N-acetyltransferase [Microbacterium sp. SORGH_AS_0888]MDQ1131353.1 RimJ/RimL family protein N-acetyltransferase [Microbacterium sp. SORGH_AS_0888]